jgi:CBS domain-containing protein
VECTVPTAPGDDAPDPEGEQTQVGALLHGEAVAVDPGVSLGDALALLRTGELRSLPVVDAQHVLVGVVHEVRLSRPVLLRTPDPEASEVSAAMSSAFAIHEGVSVRRALRLLASTHAREATVVDDAGKPVGIFRDVDGLRWIAGARVSPA